METINEIKINHKNLRQADELHWSYLKIVHQLIVLVKKIMHN